jgi:hypothetical protein
MSQEFSLGNLSNAYENFTVKIKFSFRDYTVTVLSNAVQRSILSYSVISLPFVTASDHLQSLEHSGTARKGLKRP